MNIFGFLATLCGCATCLTAVWRLTRRPIAFRIIKTVEIPEQNTPKTATEIAQDVARQAVTTEKKEPEVEVISMDAVIKNANELMGIYTISPKEDK